jgi:membrane protein
MTLPDAARDGWRARLALIVQTLQTWPWLRTLQTLRQRFRDDRLGLTASSLTFTTTIALVPLATVMLAVFSAFPMFSQFQGALEKYFIQSLVPDAIAKPVLLALTQFAGKASRLGTLGLVVLVFSAIALMLTIDHTLNAIWRVRRPRPIAQRVMVYWAAATLGPLLLGASLTLTTFAISASDALVGRLLGGLTLLFNALEFALLAGAMAALFRYVPNTEVRWRHALSGGLFVAAGMEVAKKGLAWYLGQVPGYNTIYGAFATVPIFLVWLYLVWLIVLFGAVIAAYAPSLSMHLLSRPDTAGQRFELAVQLLRELARARSLSTHGLGILDLSRTLRTQALEIEPLLDALVALDWVGRLDEDGEKRHVLLCDLATTRAEPLLATLLLDPVPAVQGFWRRADFGRITLAELVG